MSKTKIRFIFHHGKDSLVGRGIILWTWALGLFYNWKVLKYNFSHVEIWVPDEKYGFEHKWLDPEQELGPYRNCDYLGQCFSSTTRGDANGVRFAPASDVLHHPERWSYIECEVDPERLEVALEKAKKLVGNGYDYGYILSFLQPFIIQKDDESACSEIINWFAVLCGIGWREKRISPRRFAYNMAKIWHEPKLLVEKGK